jgi:phenylacetate-CoA ligase
MTKLLDIARDAGWFAKSLGRGLESRRDPVRNRQWQDAQVASVVGYAARHVPYYRQLFRDHRIEPGSIRSVDDLQRIPVTTKAMLKRLPLRDRVSDAYHPDELVRHTTSGSSGIPFEILRTWFDERRMNVFWVRHIMRQGFKPQHRAVVLTGVRTVPSGDRLFIQRWLANLGLFRTTRINCLRPADEILPDVVQRKPDHLMGYAWALLRVGEAYVASGRRGFRPRAIHSFGEVVTPAMRQRLAEAYQCPVLDVYGSYEFGMSAFECRGTSCYHVSDDSVILEVLQDGVPVGEGESGVLTGTNLLGYAMPFIRFEIGDIATRGANPCRCGWQGSTIAQLRGRMLDMFPLPGGREIHPYRIVFIIIQYLADRVFQYQLIQESMDRVVLYMVPTPGTTITGFEELTSAVEGLLGDDVRFEIRVVDAIDFEQSGKFRVSRSRVTSEYDQMEGTVR